MPALGQALGFVMLNALSRFDSLENLLFLVVQFRRNQAQNGLPDDFLSRITEYPLRTRIPRSDDTVECFAENGIIGGGDNCRQLGLRLLRRSGTLRCHRINSRAVRLARPFRPCLELKHSDPVTQRALNQAGMRPGKTAPDTHAGRNGVAACHLAARRFRRNLRTGRPRRKLYSLRAGPVACGEHGQRRTAFPLFWQHAVPVLESGPYQLPAERTWPGPVPRGSTPMVGLAIARSSKRGRMVLRCVLNEDATSAIPYAADLYE